MEAKNIRPGDITLKPGDLLEVLEEKSSCNFNLVRVIQYYQIRLAQFQQQLARMMFSLKLLLFKMT